MKRIKISDESQLTKNKIKNLIYRIDTRKTINYNKLSESELINKCKSYESSRTVMLDTIKKLRLEVMYFQKLDINKRKIELSNEIHVLRSQVNELRIKNLQLQFIINSNKYPCIGDKGDKIE